jgi:hypothetical protein
MSQTRIAVDRILREYGFEHKGRVWQREDIRAQVHRHKGSCYLQVDRAIPVQGVPLGSVSEPMQRVRLDSLDAFQSDFPRFVSLLGRSGSQAAD